MEARDKLPLQEQAYYSPGIIEVITFPDSVKFNLTHSL